MRLALICDAVFNNDLGKWSCNVIDYNLINKFKHFFDEIYIVARDGAKKNDFVDFDLDKTYIKTVKAVTSLGGLARIFNTKKQIEKAVSKCDAVYCRGTNGILAQLSAEKFKKKHVTFVGGCVYESMKSVGKFSYGIFAPLMKTFFKKSIKRSQGVIYCARYLKDIYDTKGKSFYWTEVSIERCPENKLKDRLIRIQNNKLLKVCLIGQIINNVKGIDTAIKALPLMNANVSLYILGTGDAEQWIKLAEKYRVSERVVFCKAIKGGKDVLNWIDGMDICIQPSRTEGLPKSSIEAESRGCPLVSSGVGGLSEITKKELIHYKEDNKTLAKLINRLVDDRDYMRKMAEFSIETAENYLPKVLDLVFEDICNFLTEANHD